MEAAPYGWRAKIGLIYIASAYAMEVEFNQMAPPGVTTHTTRIALCEQPEQFTVSDLSKLGKDALAATKLLAQAPLSSIAFGCTSGSFINGFAYDKAFIHQMEAVANIPCTTTANAALEALQSLHIKKVAIATPYEKDVNDLAYQYFTDGNLQITNMTGLGITNDYQISTLDTNAIYQMAMKVNTEDAEAVFLSCTGLSAANIIHMLEEDLQKPVITSNQATFWYALKLSKVNAKIKNFGQLFES
ncbi:maleate cis-trans isomerase family protein [Oceanobacillus timonensis]|uniref:maleate cis-trans isomerase family protein n=1 Tax=Oceanobacillus timonensis TaxID=1926285 RepID=UPI0009B9C9A7|nr:aspartate/glutamate racemase family protein [Oceanobacillus timonensis]